MTTETADDISDTPDGPVVLFDGVCNLCNGVVEFLIPRDPEGRLQFSPLQSEPGQELLRRHDCSTADFDTIVLIVGGQVYTKSDAVIRIAKLLGWPFHLVRIARLVPATFRDRIYDGIAANRYDWFGQKDRCMVPDQAVSDRFLT